MKQPTLFSTLLLVMTVMIIVSCKKDKDDDSSGKTKTELLTTGSWKLTAYTSNPGQDWDGNGSIETNIFNVMDACEKDGYSTFNTNGTVENNEGPLKCDALDPQSETNSWSFADNETKLLEDGYPVTLLELTTATLKVRDTFVDNGVTYTIELTFGH